MCLQKHKLYLIRFTHLKYNSNKRIQSLLSIMVWSSIVCVKNVNYASLHCRFLQWIPLNHIFNACQNIFMKNISNIFNVWGKKQKKDNKRFSMFLRFFYIRRQCISQQKIELHSYVFPPYRCTDGANYLPSWSLRRLLVLYATDLLCPVNC